MDRVTVSGTVGGGSSPPRGANEMKGKGSFIMKGLKRFLRKLFGLPLNTMEDYSANDGSYSMKGEGSSSDINTNSNGSDNGNLNGNDNKPKKSIVKKVVIGVVIIMVVYFLSGFRIVQPTHVECVVLITRVKE